MKARTLFFDIFFLMLFLAGSVYSYSQFKSAYDYAQFKQKMKVCKSPVALAETAVIQGEKSIPPPLLEGPAPQPRLSAPRENVFFYNGPGNDGILFTWMMNPCAAYYTVRISTRSDLRRPLVEETVTANSFLLGSERLSILPETTFYWSVAETDIEGETSAWSEPRTFRTGLWAW
ncbi:MAG: hypothetical protein LBG74_04265 [Spirochaetaceae bacterium]|jgi:hypothetical protein|nr:hypothetical protein [Spirochaetaceae bacterium]